MPGKLSKVPNNGTRRMKFITTGKKPLKKKKQTDKYLKIYNLKLGNVNQHLFSYKSRHI